MRKVSSTTFRKGDDSKMIYFLNESSDSIISQAKIQKKKLQSMKDQLDLLLSKKIRLDNEIKILRKSIKDKSKKFQLSLKTSINLEAFDPVDHEPTRESNQLLTESFSEAELQVFRDFDILLREIECLEREILREVNE
jgi:hypothetical protein